jgi:hypothetical protein
MQRPHANEIIQLKETKMSPHLIHFLMVERLAELRRRAGSRTTRVHPKARAAR